MEIKLIIDQNVGLTALQLFVHNSNMDVGMVTVRHLIFSELTVQIRAGKGIKDAVQVFKKCFNNKHTIEEGKGIAYESPLLPYCYIDESGIMCIKISPRLADLVYQRCQTMELNEINILAACADLTICGRMFQELTIDAAKTMYKVEIPYGEDMGKIKLASRDNTEDSFNFSCDWKYHNSTPEEQEELFRKHIFHQNQTGGNVKKWKSINYIINKSGSKQIGGRYQVADFQHEIRIVLATMGMEFADRLMQETQQLPEQVLEQVMKNMSRKEMQKARELAIFFHDVYRTIQSYKRKAIADAAAMYNDPDSSALEEHVKGIKSETRKATKGLSESLRIEFRKLKLSELDMIYVLLSVVLEEGNNAAYSHSALEQEFFKFAISIGANIQETEDELTYCDFEDGSTVLFEAGLAEDEEGHTAYAKIALEGEFIIRQKAEGKFVAASKIIDQIQMPEESDRLIFVTKPSGGKDTYTSSHLKEVTADIMSEGALVTLVPFITNNNDIHDAIVVNDTIIGSFRCSYAINGQYINSMALNDMYKYKQGIVEHIIVSKQDEYGEIAVITLKNVKTVEAPVITRNKIEEWNIQKAQEMAAKAKERKAKGQSLFRIASTNTISLKGTKTTNQNITVPVIKLVLPQSIKQDNIAKPKKIIATPQMILNFISC